MEREQKELEGPDFEREQRVEQSRREQHEEEQLPEVIAAEVRDVGLDHRSRLFDALQLILAGEKVNVSLFYLPQREQLALEALQAAVTGSDTMGEFVFAEDRRMLLEQALAVLQQNLTYGEPAQLAELQGKFDALTAQVGTLRSELVALEDAQEEVDEFHQKAKERFEDAADKTEPPKPKPDAGLVDFIADALFAMADVAPSKSSTLAGEERASRPSQPSSLTHGPEVKEPPKLPSTLAATDRPEVTQAPKQTSLTGADLPEPPKPPSTLDGPELLVTPKPKSTLGDVEQEATTATHDATPQRRKAMEPPQLPPKGGS